VESGERVRRKGRRLLPVLSWVQVTIAASDGHIELLEDKMQQQSGKV
jgi:hypothetical protein